MPEDSVNSVDAFDARYTPKGRLQRYARGRVASFFSRQFLTLSGTVCLILLVSPEVGMLACCLALLGEAVDCLTLRHVDRMVTQGLPLRRARVLSTITGTFQAMTIAACVILAWVTAPGSGGTFFSLAYLTGAAINAGLVLPFHPTVTKARLGVYFLCVVGLFTYSALFRLPDPPYLLWYDLSGALMMGYMAYVFIQYTVKGFGVQRRNRRELLLQREDLSKAYAELRENQKETRNLSLVARHAMDSVIMSDPHGRILWVNTTFTRVTGYTPEEAVGQTPGELLNGPETDLSVSDEIAHAIAKGIPHRAQILNYRKDGHKIWTETTLVPVLDDKGQVEMVVSIERDVTQARAHAQELASAKARAEEAANSKSRFLATMSHEIRTPMNGIIGMAELLCEADLPDEYRDNARTIWTSAEALLAILNDILDLSKLEASRIELDPVDFNPVECVARVVQLLRPQAAARGLTLDFAADELPAMVRADDARLRQVLLNVIGNAVKFTETGGVQVRLDRIADRQGQRLRIRIDDTGIGIPADRLSHIFDPFAQADTDTTRRFGGTGLGLSISQRLMKAMGGRVSVNSTVGKGSCFTVELPVDPPSGNACRPGSIEYQPGTTTPLTVLVAEDNETNRLVIRKFLKDCPITLYFAHDGEEAVALTRQHAPDVVFMDMSMPRMDGLTATRHIREGPAPQPRIVALTANGFASDRQACIDAGMDDFLTKPVRKAELFQSLAGNRPIV